MAALELTLHCLSLARFCRSRWSVPDTKQSLLRSFQVAMIKVMEQYARERKHKIREMENKRRKWDASPI